MKEFEKWFDDYIKKIPDKWNRVLAVTMKKLYGFIWKAALKWAIIQDTDLNATELADAIRKELEDEEI